MSSTQSPQTRPSSKVVFSSVLWPGVRGGGSEGREGRQQSLWLSERSLVPVSVHPVVFAAAAAAPPAGQLSQEAVLGQVATVQTHLVQ